MNGSDGYLNNFAVFLFSDHVHAIVTQSLWRIWLRENWCHFFWKLQNPPLGCRGSRFSPKWPWSRFLTQMTFNDIYVTYMLGSMALLWHSHSDTYDFWPLSKCFFEAQIPPSRVQRVQIFIYQMQMTMIQIPGHKWLLMTYMLGSMALLWHCHNDTYTLSRIFYIYT